MRCPSFHSATLSHLARSLFIALSLIITYAPSAAAEAEKLIRIEDQSRQLLLAGLAVIDSALTLKRHSAKYSQQFTLHQDSFARHRSYLSEHDTALLMLGSYILQRAILVGTRAQMQQVVTQLDHYSSTLSDFYELAEVAKQQQAVTAIAASKYQLKLRALNQFLTQTNGHELEELTRMQTYLKALEQQAGGALWVNFLPNDGLTLIQIKQQQIHKGMELLEKKIVVLSNRIRELQNLCTAVTSS